MISGAKQVKEEWGIRTLPFNRNRNANTVFLADLEEDNESDRELSDSDFNPETCPDFINMYVCFLPYFIISHITFSGRKIIFIGS